MPRFYQLSLLSLSLRDATHHVIVLDAVLGLLDAGLERAEAPGEGEAERAAVIPGGLTVAVVAIDGLCAGCHVIVERIVGSEAHRQPVALEERALQGGVIAVIGVLHVVDA